MPHPTSSPDHARSRPAAAVVAIRSVEPDALSNVKVDPLSMRAAARVDIDLNGAFPRNAYDAVQFAALIGQ